MFGKKKEGARAKILDALSTEHENGEYPHVSTIANKSLNYAEALLRFLDDMKVPLTFDKLRKRTGLSKSTISEKDD